eukprot:5637768-Prymnesium_polylepis.1
MGIIQRTFVVGMVVVVVGGLAWSGRQAFETDNTPRFKIQNLMATRRRFEPLLKKDLHSLGKDGGSPWDPVGKGFSPCGLGRACVACA